MTSYYEIIVWRNDITTYNIIVLRYHIVRHGMGQTMITCYTVNINNNVTTNMTKTVTYDLHLEYIIYVYMHIYIKVSYITGYMAATLWLQRYIIHTVK